MVVGALSISLQVLACCHETVEQLPQKIEFVLFSSSSLGFSLSFPLQKAKGERKEEKSFSFFSPKLVDARDAQIERGDGLQ